MFYCLAHDKALIALPQYDLDLLLCSKIEPRFIAVPKIELGFIASSIDPWIKLPWCVMVSITMPL